MKNGLYLFGTIIGRYKETKNSDNGKYETVKYSVNCDGHVIRVSERNPKEYHEIGEVVEFPVTAGVYDGHLYFKIRNAENSGSNF